MAKVCEFTDRTLVKRVVRADDGSWKGDDGARKDEDDNGSGKILH